MQELCLAIVLVWGLIGGLEYVATVAVNWTSHLAQADDLEDMLDLDLDRGTDFEMDFDSATDSELPSQPAPADRKGP